LADLEKEKKIEEKVQKIMEICVLSSDLYPSVLRYV